MGNEIDVLNEAIQRELVRLYLSGALQPIKDLIQEKVPFLNKKHESVRVVFDVTVHDTQDTSGFSMRARVPLASLNLYSTLSNSQEAADLADQIKESPVSPEIRNQIQSASKNPEKQVGLGVARQQLIKDSMPCASCKGKGYVKRAKSNS